jgi:hypothetical protein
MNNDCKDCPDPPACLQWGPACNEIIESGYDDRKLPCSACPHIIDCLKVGPLCNKSGSYYA